jgi:hypothetical protein
MCAFWLIPIRPPHGPAPAGLFLCDVGYRTALRRDHWKLDAAAVNVDDEDPRSRTARCSRMRDRVGHAYGRHLCRLAAQQVIAEAHLPKPILKTNDNLLDRHGMLFPDRVEFLFFREAEPQIVPVAASADADSGATFARASS